MAIVGAWLQRDCRCRGIGSEVRVLVCRRSTTPGRDMNTSVHTSNVHIPPIYLYVITKVKRYNVRLSNVKPSKTQMMFRSKRFECGITPKKRLSSTSCPQRQIVVIKQHGTSERLCPHALCVLEVALAAFIVVQPIEEWPHCYSYVLTGVNTACTAVTQP